MQAYGEFIYSAFLNSALDGGGSSASRSGRFTRVESITLIHWIGGWVGPTANLQDLERRKCRAANLHISHCTCFIPVTNYALAFHSNHADS